MKKFQVSHDTISVDAARFPNAKELTFVLIADLHGSWYGPEQRRLTEVIRAQKPDLILCAGDLVTRGEPEQAAVTLLEGLTGIAPVFCSNGNHESSMRKADTGERIWLQYEDRLNRLGVHVLNNEEEHITLKGLPLLIAGLEIEASHYKRIGAPRITAEEVKRLLNQPSKKEYSLLIAHNPMGFPAYADWGADLVVAGHLHGGYIRLPCVGGVISPQLRLFPKYDQGVFTHGMHYMAVSAGLGEHGPVFRFRNPRELVVLHLVPTLPGEY